MAAGNDNASETFTDVSDNAHMGIRKIDSVTYEQINTFVRSIDGNSAPSEL